MTLDLTTVHKCCICDGDIEHHKTKEGKTYWTQGHNAQPIKEGQCCDSCNNMIVLPQRFKNILALSKANGQTNLVVKLQDTHLGGCLFLFPYITPHASSSEGVASASFV